MISLCIFGSQARGSPDRFSDFDLLIAGKDTERLKPICASWERRGWNVSAYQLSDLERLAAQKSLFIQHLKAEGQILQDEAGQLRQVLDIYQPHKSYIPQRNDALRQVLSLPRAGLNDDVNACVADIACVLFRNFAILHLASKGIYEFSYDRLTGHMAQEFDLKSDWRKALLSLRLAKHKYRNRLISNVERLCLPEVREAASYIANRIGDISQSAITDGTHGNRYMMLRLRELELIQHYGIRYLDALPRHAPLGLEWFNIRKYRSYPTKADFN